MVVIFIPQAGPKAAVGGQVIVPDAALTTKESIGGTETFLDAPSVRSQSGLYSKCKNDSPPRTGESGPELSE